MWRQWLCRSNHDYRHFTGEEMTSSKQMLMSPARSPPPQWAGTWWRQCMADLGCSEEVSLLHWMPGCGGASLASGNRPECLKMVFQAPEAKGGKCRWLTQPPLPHHRNSPAKHPCISEQAFPWTSWRGHAFNSSVLSSRGLFHKITRTGNLAHDY